jgi:hypothetical protein
VKRKPTPAPKKKGRIARRAEKATAAAARATYKPALILSAAAVLQMAHAGPWGWVTLGGVITFYARNGIDSRRERRSGGKRAARQRRKFQGFATGRELRRNLSASAVRKDAKVTRPSFGGRTHGMAASDCGLQLCTGGKRPRPLYSGWRNCVQVFGTTGAGKTGYLGGVILDAPGAVIASTSRTDLRDHTVLPRSEMGPVWDLFPRGEGGTHTSFGWSPLVGSPMLAQAGIDDSCRNPDTAADTAGYLMHAAPKDTSGSGQWFDGQGHVLLRLMLHAAACKPGGSMLDALAWVRNPRDPQPLAILADTQKYGTAPGWAHELVSMLERYGDVMDSITATAALALAWLTSPEMAQTACPELSGRPQLDPAEFITTASTLYICSEDRPHSSVTPYKACLMGRLFDTGRRIATHLPGGRLDPPLAFVLDEAWKSGLPLDDWMAVAGGYGMPLVTGWQSRSQIFQKYGPDGGRAFWDAAPAKMIFGGYDDAQALKDFSEVCGMRDTWHWVKHPDGSKTPQHDKEPLVDVGRLSNLGEAQVVLLYRRTRTVIGMTKRVWEHDRYEGTPAPGWQPEAPQRAVEQQPAIDAPHREAIATPYAPPAAVSASHNPISPLPPVSDAEPVPASIDTEEFTQWASQQEPTSRSATAPASG